MQQFPYPVLKALGVTDEQWQKSIVVQQDVRQQFMDSQLNPHPYQLWQSDNMAVLNSWATEKPESVDVIYIDPPYNTQKSAFRYHDNRSHREWIAFMAPRLHRAKELLKKTGVILVSIDDHEMAYLKVMLDQIFGEDQFVANFIWKKSHTVKNDKRTISGQHEYVFCYAKDIRHVHINRQRVGEAYLKKAYRFSDAKGVFRVVPLHKKKNKISYTVTSPSGKTWQLGWNYNEEGFKRLLEDDMVYWGKSGDGVPSKKVYLKENMDKPYGTMLDPAVVKYTGQGGADIKALGLDHIKFLYAKPVDLIKHLLEAVVPKQAHVLDFFAGSGTTLEAVLRLNEETKSKHRCTLITNNEDGICEDLTLPRCQKAIEKHASKNDFIFHMVEP